MLLLSTAKKKAYYYINPSYSLLPFRFSANEVSFLEYIYSLLKGSLKSNELQLLNIIITKIKQLSADGEIKLRDSNV